jgi:hypothetical protein
MSEPVNCTNLELSIYLQALGEGYLRISCSDINQSPPLKSIHIASKSYQRGKKTVHFPGFQFLMMSLNLTESRGLDYAISSQAVFPAKILVPLEKAQELTESAPTSGGKWHESFAKYNHATRSWKTRQCSLLEDFTEFSGTWPKWGSMRNGVCSAQLTAVHRICGKEFGWLPTPVKSDATTGAIIGKNDSFYMTKTGMPRKVNQNGKDGSVGLGRLVQLQAQKFPTPTKSAAKGASSNRPPGHPRHNDSLCTAVEMATGELTGRLNPQWVEWLMGWPIGWTGLKHLETDKFPEWRQQHSPFYEKD